MTSRITAYCKKFGGLLSKPPIRQNKFPAKISGHTVIQTQLVVWVTVKGDGQTLITHFHPSLPHLEVFDIHAPLNDKRTQTEGDSDM